MRRRIELLREKCSEDAEARLCYLKMRADLLRRRYGHKLSCHERNSSIGSLASIGEIKDSRKDETAVVKKQTVGESFAFAGVHHVFDQHRLAVPMLKFANNDRSKLCCASWDGTISICDVSSDPPQVIAFLEGHKKGVTAIDWSTSNDLIVSSALDATVRLWKVELEGINPSPPHCLRVVTDQLSAEILCCAFIPLNNNIVITGNSLGFIRILNISTGIYSRRGTCKIGGKASFRMIFTLFLTLK